MTSEQKRIKIAEACGWEKRPEPPGSLVSKTWWRGPHRYPTNVMPVPNYFSDLNACHEMENHLGDKWPIYIDLLRESPHISFHTGAYLLVHATAAQRAEAFGKTMNLW